MGCKKGQFYLIAAVLIVVLIVAAVTVYNYSKKRDSVALYDLGEELGIESQYVLDSGTAANMDTLLGNFIEDYVDYVGEGKKLYFVYGDASGSGLTIVSYEGESTAQIQTASFREEGGQVIIVVEEDGKEIEYQFDLETGHGFYFVISQEIDGEKYVVQG